MDFDSPDPDVEKEFPGLFASGATASRKKDDDDCKCEWHTQTECIVNRFNCSYVVSDAEHEKISKKELLLGRRKDKKDKKSSYATLDGESSPEEDFEPK